LTPELYSFAKNKHFTIQKILSQNDFTQLLHLPISEVAFGQMQQIMQDLDNVLITDSKDIWRFAWGTNFSSS